jgi:ketopantoate reductase
MKMFDYPRVVVIGAGAMGSVFSGQLAAGGLDVALVDLWQEHVDAINSRGLRLGGHGGDRSIKVRATTDASTILAADVVFFQYKASMCADLAAGRRTEVGYIYGSVIRRAGKHQIPVPTLKILAALIKGRETAAAGL